MLCRKHSRRWLWATLVVTSCLAGPVYASRNSIVLHAKPNVVQIGAFFHGAKIHVTGEIPQGCDAVVELTGEAVEEKLMRKARKGWLWMNSGNVEVRGAPSAYILLSTGRETPSDPPGNPAWGYGVLKRRISFSGDIKDGEHPMLFEQFVKLKESEKLYSVILGALKVKQSVGDEAAVDGAFDLSPKISAGTYQLCLVAIKDGRPLGRKCTSLEVVPVGFPALVASLAHDYAALYGTLAVALAVVTGFVMAYLFRGKRVGR